MPSNSQLAGFFAIVLTMLVAMIYIFHKLVVRRAIAGYRQASLYPLAIAGLGWLVSAKAGSSLVAGLALAGVTIPGLGAAAALFTMKDEPQRRPGDVPAGDFDAYQQAMKQRFSPGADAGRGDGGRASAGEGEKAGARGESGSGPRGGPVPDEVRAALAYFGLPQGCSREDVTTAYREKVKALHPDRWGGLPAHIVKQLEEEQKLCNHHRDILMKAKA